jgi:hypothetical protein
MVSNPNTGLHEVNFTFPDGSTNSTQLSAQDPLMHARMFFATDAPNLSSLNIPFGDITTNYYVTASLQNTTLTYNYERQLEAEPDSQGILLDNGVWISRVKCTPTMLWRLASCTWDGTFMRNCNSSPNHNATALDTIGLNALATYQNAIGWKLYNDGDALVTNAPWPGYPPTTAHFDTINGFAALAIALTASQIEFGTAVVRTVGEPAREVYVVRMNVLGVVFLMLLAALSLSMADIALNVRVGRLF